MISVVKFASLFGMSVLLSPCGLSVAQSETGPETPPDKSEKATEVKPILNLRLRYEGVSQDNLLSDADALTYRVRAGLQFENVFDSTFLVEFEHVEDVIDDFNSDPFTPNANSGVYSVVPDPNVTELNRLQLVNKSLPNTIVTLGRQRLILDDSRFIGNVGWRQNEQTFDGVRVQNSSLGELNLDVTYLNRVNRIFGDESNVGSWDGDTYLVNANHVTPLGKLVAFAYFIDVDNAAGVFSNQTLGARLSGKKEVLDGKLSYAFSYANQEDYGSSDLDYRAQYVLAEGAYSTNGFTTGAGLEILGGDTQRGFQAPLSTLHKFNGWADVFLNTPSGGIEDLFLKFGYAPGTVGPFENAKFSVRYHDYSSEVGSVDYGSELNLSAAADVSKVKLLLKYADYAADNFAVDTQKLWAQIDYRF